MYIYIYIHIYIYHTPNLLYPFICRWTFMLLPCLVSLIISVSVTPSTSLHQCLLYTIRKGDFSREGRECLREPSPGRGSVWVVGLLQRPGAKSRAKQEKATLGSGFLWLNGHELQYRACSRSRQMARKSPGQGPFCGGEWQRRLGYSLAWAFVVAGRKSPTVWHGWQKWGLGCQVREGSV